MGRAAGGDEGGRRRVRQVRQSGDAAVLGVALPARAAPPQLAPQRQPPRQRLRLHRLRLRLRRPILAPRCSSPTPHLLLLLLKNKSQFEFLFTGRPRTGCLRFVFPVSYLSKWGKGMESKSCISVACGRDPKAFSSRAR